ncbi:unnamed protein product [Angiostrongylus costaricensis]|uniref:ANK_REP_REGION domain-containing protein n=1 Tax=Angiostrongylus costaricensis TaxID=334426 RepID=A0A158PM08_ANGCS|nr:unnamed protein product [Angiostrongylus costaricensis]
MSGSTLLRALDNHDRAETERLLELQPVDTSILLKVVVISSELSRQAFFLCFPIVSSLTCMQEEIAIRDPDERVALHYAAETMDLEMFQKILERDVTLLDCEDRNGLTPMLMAVMGGRTDLVKLLLSRGANIEHRDRDGHSAVHWAVVCGQLDMLTFLLAEGADVEAHDLLWHFSNVCLQLQRATPLHYATAAEETSTELALAILHTLLKEGAKPNCRDLDERTPILWAASNGRLFMERKYMLDSFKRRQKTELPLF